MFSQKSGFFLKHFKTEKRLFHGIVPAEAETDGTFNPLFRKPKGT